jgi:hypothetical protein
MIYGGKSNRLQPPKEISLEHILPQTPAEDSQWCKDFTEQDRKEWTDRLGNLVLISGRKNITQGRLNFAEKKKRYFQKHIETFTYLLHVLNNNHTWTIENLKANHQETLETLKRYYGQS